MKVDFNLVGIEAENVIITLKALKLKWERWVNFDDDNDDDENDNENNLWCY